MSLRTSPHPGLQELSNFCNYFRKFIQRGRKSGSVQAMCKKPLVFNAPNSPGAVQATTALLCRRKSVPRVMWDNRLNPNHTQITWESSHVFEAGAAAEKSPTVPRAARVGGLYWFLLAARSGAHQTWKLHEGYKCISSNSPTSATLGQVKTPSKGCLSMTDSEQQLQDSPEGLNLLTGRRCPHGSSGAHPSGPPLRRHRTASSSPRLTAPGKGRDGGEAHLELREVLDKALRAPSTFHCLGTA